MENIRRGIDLAIQAALKKEAVKRLKKEKKS
jgi:hypothetical protein